jgi:chromosomal replication initiator protein
MLHDDIWDKCLNIIKENVNAESFNTWFIPMRPLKFEEKTLTVQIPNQFFYEWLEEHYLAVLKNAIMQTVGVGGNLEYSLMPKVEKKKKEKSVELKNIFQVFKFNPKYTLENFIEGDCNHLAKSAAQSIILKFRNNPFNPFMVYGNVGLGKTHLVQAIGNEILKKERDAKVVYIPTGDFVNQFVNSIKNNDTSKFLKYYSDVDVLILDDIQFLKNKTKTQEILFNIFNKLHQEGKEIILTSDCVPESNQGIQERLVSRFKWGLTVNISQPDLETKIAIIKSKADDLNIDIDYKTIENLIDNQICSIRELEGMFLSMIAENKNFGHNEKVLELEKLNVKKITFGKIIAFACKHFKISEEEIFGSCRKKEIVIARQVVMYLCKELLNMSLCEIGEKVGNRDHSTVIHAIRNVAIKYRENINSLVAKINS